MQDTKSLVLKNVRIPCSHNIESEATFQPANNSPSTNHEPVVGCRFLHAALWFEDGSGADSHWWIFSRRSSSQVSNGTAHALNPIYSYLFWLTWHRLEWLISDLAWLELWLLCQFASTLHAHSFPAWCSRDLLSVCHSHWQWYEYREYRLRRYVYSALQHWWWFCARDKRQLWRRP